MAEIICARECAKTKLRQERERFLCALEDKRVEGLCYQWLRTVPLVKSFTECQKLFDSFLRMYYMPFTYDNTRTGGRFIEIMASYTDDDKKKTRKMFEVFHKEMVAYCQSVVGVLIGGTRGGKPILFEEDADDTWWHYDECPPCKKHATTWKEPLVTEEGIWSGMTRCPANKTCPCHPEPPVHALLRQTLTEPLKKILKIQHQYTLQLATLGPIPDMEYQLRLDYWGVNDDIIRDLRSKTTNLERQLTKERDKISELECAEERHITQSDDTIRDLENNVVRWRQHSLELENRCKQLDVQCRRFFNQLQASHNPPLPPLPPQYKRQRVNYYT